MTRVGPSALSRGHATAPEHRRKARACDYCRCRKTKCEREAPEKSLSKSDSKCNNCKISKIECTYEQEAKPRGYTLSYTGHLEDRQRRIEKLLSRLCPTIDTLREFGPPIAPWRDVSPTARQKHSTQTKAVTGVGLDPPLSLRPRPSGSHEPFGSHLSPAWNSSARKKITSFTHWREPPSLTNDDDSIPSSDDEYCDDRPPRLGTYDEEDGWSPMIPRFHGKSSCFSLVNAMRELQVTGQTTPDMEYELENAVRMANQPSSVIESKIDQKSKLEDARGGHQVSLELVFPPEDLLAILVDLFLNRVNIIRPLLHRPTFLNDIAVQRHKTDPGFACLVLAVCAVASRYCEDPRVLAKVAKRHTGQVFDPPPPQLPLSEVESWFDDLDQVPHPYKTHEDASWRSAGWKYYDRVDRFMRSDAYPSAMLEAIKLTEVQTTYLLYQYLLGQESYSRGWCMVGAAIRRAQDLGAHRKKRYSERSLEGELWKRALWCLVLADRDAGLYGHPGFSCAEYFDIKLPLEVDDEYWTVDEHGQNPVFLEQPPGRPAVISAFNAQVNLSVVNEFATSYLHPVDESRLPSGFRPSDIMAQLDKAMTAWTQSIPSHLKSDVAPRNPVWRMQSNILHIDYHLLRIHIYKCFIPDEKVRTPPRGSTYPGVPSAASVSTYRTCSMIPTASDARSICALSARAIATFLRDTLSIIRADAPGPVQLCDVPSFIAGASLVGTILHNIGSAKRTSASSLSQSLPRSGFVCMSHASSVNDDSVAFSVCLDFLGALQDRWASALTHRTMLIPDYKKMQGNKRQRPLSGSGYESQQEIKAFEQRLFDGPPQVSTYTDLHVEPTSPVVSRPLSTGEYVHEESLASQNPAGARSFDSASPETSTSPSSNEPLDDFRQTSILDPTSQSHDSRSYLDEYGAVWISSPDDLYFETLSKTPHPFNCEPLGEQFAHPLPEWKASHMPPYQVPTNDAPAFPVPVGDDTSQRFYSTLRHPIPQGVPPSLQTGRHSQPTSVCGVMVRPIDEKVTNFPRSSAYNQHNSSV